MPVVPSCAPVGRNRSEAPAAPKRNSSFAEASMCCFAVALSAWLRSSPLASPASTPSFARCALERRLLQNLGESGPPLGGVSAKGG